VCVSVYFKCVMNGFVIFFLFSFVFVLCVLLVLVGAFVCLFVCLCLFGFTGTDGWRRLDL
jgi:hypothetical protein